jgi:hypothetical protein
VPAALHDISFSGTTAPEAPVAGTLAWYDAADTTTLTIVSNKVSAWNDKSGNGHHLSQSTAGNRPLYDASPRTVNGVIIPEFTGAGTTYMDSTCPMDDRTASVFLALFFDGYGTPVGDQQGGGFEIRWDSNGRAQFLKSGVAFLSSNTGAPNVGQKAEFFCGRLDASNLWWDVIGNSVTASESTTFTAGRTLRLGQDQSGTIRHDGLIMEAIFYGSKVSDLDVIHNFHYLVYKWCFA